MKAEPTAFAVLDILGYGELMRRDPVQVFDVIKDLIESSSANWPIQRDLNRFCHFSNEPSPPQIQYLQFSDTLIIWLTIKQDTPTFFREPGNIVRSICYAAALTIARFLRKGIPLRGAVGFGPTFISTDPLFFTGSELYETMKLERMQSWAGAALHESAMRTSDLESLEPFCLNYSVPMSEVTNSGPNVAIDWVSCISMEWTPPPPWDQMFLSEHENVLRKAKETRKFYDMVKPLRRGSPIYLS